MLSLLSWILTGLIVGLVAQAIISGRRHVRLITAVYLGVVGSCLGGLLSAAIWPTWTNDLEVDQMWPGWLMSVAGAVVILWGYADAKGQTDVAYNSQ